MTSLADVSALLAGAQATLRSADRENLGQLAITYRHSAIRIYAEANQLLQDEPVEALHPIYGTGVVVGVNQSGWALFHPDGSDRPVEVDIIELRETRR